MRAMLWFGLMLVMDVLALDMLVWYADAQAAAVVLVLVFVCFGMSCYALADRTPRRAMLDARTELRQMGATLYEWFMRLCLDCRTDRYRGTKDGRIWE